MGAGGGSVNEEKVVKRGSNEVESTKSERSVGVSVLKLGNLSVTKTEENSSNGNSSSTFKAHTGIGFSFGALLNFSVDIQLGWEVKYEKKAD